MYLTLAAAVEFNLDLTNKMPKKKLNQDIYKYFKEKSLKVSEKLTTASRVTTLSCFERNLRP